MQRMQLKVLRIQLKTILAGVVCVTALNTQAVAGSLAEQFANCASKFASTTKPAMVMLECTAADGKLGACKVLDAPNPAEGFDKAAMCVADVLPIGSRTGTVKVPIKFDPQH